LLHQRDIIGIDLLDQKSKFPVMMEQEKKGSILVKKGKGTRNITIYLSSVAGQSCQVLTFQLVDGSTFGLRPLFLLRDKGKRTEMTGTQHVETLKHQFLHYITIKMVLVIFYHQNNFKHNSCFLHLCYLVAASTGSKLQLFQRWRVWE
jgi:hypothetical protein